MTSTQRIKNTISGKDIDRTAISGWVHMPLVDQNMKDFTKATIDFTDNNSWDFVKLMYHGYFFTRGYGAEMTYSTDAHQWWATITKYPVNGPMDFTKLEPLDVYKTTLANDIEFSKRIVDHYDGTVPVIGTLFTPLTFAQELYAFSRPEVIRHMMTYYPDELHKGLSAITETCCRFARELVKAGVDGMFYATQFGTLDYLTQEQHDEFARPYDLKILEAIKEETWFNILHVHGNNNLNMKEYIDYPVEALNWEHCGDTVESSSSFASVRELTDKVLIGGVNQFKDLYSPENNREAVKEVLRRRFKECYNASNKEKFIFSPGCGFELDINPYLYTLFLEVAEEETV